MDGRKVSVVLEYQKTQGDIPPIRFILDMITQNSVVFNGFQNCFTFFDKKFEQSGKVCCESTVL